MNDRITKWGVLLSSALAIFIVNVDVGKFLQLDILCLEDSSHKYAI